MARMVGSNAILEVTFRSTYQEQRVLNVFHYRWHTLGAATADGNDIVDLAVAALQQGENSAVPAYRDIVNEEFTLERLRYQWIFPFRWSFVSSDLNCGFGTKVGDPMPSNIGITAQKITEYPGPAGRGSTHFTGMRVQDYDEATWQIPVRTNVGVFMDKMDQTIDTADVLAGSFLQPVVLHKSDPATSAQWSGTYVNPEPRVMRRRTLRVGE